MNNSLRDLYLGEDTYIESWSHYKRAILTSHLSVFCILSSVFYTTFFAFHGVTYNLFVYVFLASTASVSFLLVRIRKYTAAKIILLLAVNIVILMSLMLLKKESGASVFFFCCILAAFTLFGYEQRKIGYFFTFFSVVLFLFNGLNNMTAIQQIQISEDGVQITNMINFVVAAIVSLLMINFLLKINIDSEQILKENEASLKELNKELTDSRRRFELAIQGLNAGMWDWNATTDRIYVSPTLTKMLGYSLEEVYNVGKNAFLKIVHRDDIPAFEAAIKKHYKTKQPLEIECRFLKKDGSFLEVLDTAQSEWDAEGNVIRMVGSIVDIADRKNVERQMKQQNAMLEKTNEELDRFVYIASHDLRAPLSSVLGLLQVAEMSTDPKELAQCLQMIEERIVTLNGFIRDIIDYSRNTRLEVSNEPIRLRELIDSIIEGLKFFEKSQSINFKRDFADDMEIHLDKGRLKIILNNLIANAIKYHDTSNDHAFIRINAQLLDRQLKIEVEDNGMGISEEYVGKIFNMFYRASEKSEGSGLGLYITKEMVEKLNGSIQVQSEEGVGSKFALTFPLELMADTPN